jgi:hypothetical protein
MKIYGWNVFAVSHVAFTRQKFKQKMPIHMRMRNVMVYLSSILQKYKRMCSSREFSVSFHAHLFTIESLPAIGMPLGCFDALCNSASLAERPSLHSQTLSIAAEGLLATRGNQRCVVVWQRASMKNASAGESAKPVQERYI